MNSTSALSHKLFRTTISKGLAPRQFRFVISSESVDRDKDVIRLDAWNLSEYEKNPVVLASHDHQRLPVGKSVEIGVRGAALKATVEFPPVGIYDYADTVHDLVAAGFLNAASVGFRATDSEPNGFGGYTIKKATLLEWSICAIGSNSDAMVERSAPPLMEKWLQSKHQHEEDTMNTLEDGGMWLEVTDDFWRKNTDDDFAAMCARMLSAYEEMTSDKFRELMARQLATLGPNATIADLCRGMMEQGVVAQRSWTPETYEIDERQLGRLIAEVIAEEAANATKAALNSLVGRLD